MALSANKLRTLRSALDLAFKVKDAHQTYAGSLAALAGPDHPTAADRGYGRVWSGAAGEIPLGGFVQRKVKGDTAATPVKEMEVRSVAEDFIAERIAVTGAAAITDVGKPVYWSDDDTLTLTRPTRGIPAGVIVRWHTSTTSDVFIFGFATLCAIGLGGAGQELVYLGHYDADSVATGDLRTGLPLQYRGKILNVFAMVDKAITGAGGTAAINLEIDGTNITGGVVTVSTAAGGTKGAKLSGTAVTAANVFSEAALLDVEAATVTDMTGGSFDLYMEVERLFGV